MYNTCTVENGYRVNGFKIWRCPILQLLQMFINMVTVKLLYMP